jgi:hypothetical protein
MPWRHHNCDECADYGAIVNDDVIADYDATVMRSRVCSGMGHV